MRERMLEADVEELEGRGTSLLATHVRECAACAGIARGLVRDTRVLAAVAERSPSGVVALVPRRRRNGSYLMIGGAAAAIAASVLFVAQRSARSDAVSAPAFVTAPAVLAAIGDTVVSQMLPLNVRRFADATPVVAVPLVPVIAAPALPVADGPAMVRVDPPEGVRAAVMQTGNPSITVVVLYKPLSGPQK
jgi:hypothetical protein